MIEYWDLYNKKREKIGKLHQRGKPLEDGTYHIVVNVWIINSKNEVLLAQRHPKKELWGGLWECSASGSVLAGEDSLQGALRETEEEIGVELQNSDVFWLESIIRTDDFRDTYLVEKDICIDDLKFHPEEVVNAKWVTKQEYEKMCVQGLLAPPVQNFYKQFRTE